MLEGIAANFEKWETASSNDDSDYALDCHSHLHIFLSRTAVNMLSALEDTAGWKAILARIKKIQITT